MSAMQWYAQAAKLWFVKIKVLICLLLAICLVCLVLLYIYKHSSLVEKKNSQSHILSSVLCLQCYPGQI